MRAHIAGDMGGIPAALPLLTEIVEKDPSDDVALAAAYAIRRTTVGALVGSLERRLQSGTRDPAAHERLTREIERHQVFAVRPEPPALPARGAAGASRSISTRSAWCACWRSATSATAARARSTSPRRCDVSPRQAVRPRAHARRQLLSRRREQPDDARFQRDFARLYEPMHVRFLPDAGQPRLGAARQPRRRGHALDEVEVLADARDPLHLRRRADPVLRDRHQLGDARRARLAGPRAGSQHRALEDRLRTPPDLLLRRARRRAGGSRQRAAAAARAREHLPVRPRARSAAPGARGRCALRDRGRRRRAAAADQGRSALAVRGEQERLRGDRGQLAPACRSTSSART